MSVVGDRVLLVPMHVDALAVGAEGTRSDGSFQWSRLSPDFGRLKNEFFLGPDLVNDLFAQTRLESGVHLHFRLPRAFIRGTQSEQGPLNLPQIPNRWLVQRYADKPGSHRAFLVRSDAPVDQGGCVWPVFPGSPEEQLKLLRIGSCTELVAPPQPEPPGADGTAQRLRITAVGPGDPLFAAHYPTCRAVLGFHDPLAGITAPTRLHYIVTGWFSDQQDDPLWVAMQSPLPEGQTRSQQLMAWLQKQKWLLGESCVAAPDSTPQRMLLHGAVRGLQWKGANADYSSDDPADLVAKHQISLGQTTAEALATLFTDDPVEQVLLTSLQEDLLQPGSTVETVRSGLHARQFDAVRGGTTYTLRPEAENAGPAAAQGSGDMVPSATELPADLASMLDDLNAAQARLDDAARRMEDHRRLLHALWYRLTAALKRAKASEQDLIKELRAQFTGFRDEACPAAAEALAQAIRARDEIYAEPRGGAASVATGSLARRLGAQTAPEEDGSATGGAARPPGTRYRLVRSPAPAFHVAGEPAVAISGPAMGPRYTAEPPGEVTCRLGTQIVAAVDVPIVGQPPARVQTDWLCRQVLGAPPPALDDLHLSLLGETLLLDPHQVGTIADRVLQIASTANRQEVIAALEPLTGPAAGATVPPARVGQLVGVAPPPTAQFDRSLANPWNPIALLWEVAWLPDRRSAGDDALAPDVVRSRWALDDSGELTGSAGDVQEEKLITGQSLLKPGAAAELCQRLAGVDSSLALVQQLTHLQAVSQRLAGFNAALAMRQLTMLLPEMDYRRWSQPQTRRELRPDPVQALLAGPEYPRRWAPGTGPFMPMREGCLELRRLSVVDAFGQTLKLRDAKRPLPKVPVRVSHPCRTGVDALPGARLVPRLMQPARLCLDWGSPGQDDAVCGWIVPNHLDYSLTVHAADGRALGMLQKKLGQRALTDDLHAFFWVDSPGTATAGGEAEPATARDLTVQRVTARVRDGDLRAFCLWVLGLDPDAGALLFALIGDQVAMSDARVPEAEATLPALVGQPLVLARGRLRLEAAGLTAHKPGLRAMQGPQDAHRKATAQYALDTRGIERVRWPVRLGQRRARDDGLLGFFVQGAGAEGAPREFHPSWGRMASTQAQLPPGWKAADPDRATAFAQQDLCIDCMDALELVLLMDPQARVHVTSGMLPVASFELPPRMLAGRRRVREVFFQTAPVIGLGEAPEMPVPSDDYGVWSWHWRPDVTHWRVAPELVEAAERAGFDGRWPRVAEGWLRLLLDPLRILSFWAVDAPGPVPPGSRVKLAWMVQGCERLQLCRLGEGGKEEVLGSWDAHPLPTAQTVRVDRETTFRLKAVGDGTAATRELVVNTGKGNQ